MTYGSRSPSGERSSRTLGGPSGSVALTDVDSSASRAPRQSGSGRRRALARVSALERGLDPAERLFPRGRDLLEVLAPGQHAPGLDLPDLLAVEPGAPHHARILEHVQVLEWRGTITSHSPPACRAHPVSYTHLTLPTSDLV